MSSTAAEKKPRICITLGDPAGVGPEVVVRALARPALGRSASFLLLGHGRVLEETCKRLGKALPWRICNGGGLLFSQALQVFEPVGLGGRCPRPGRWTARTGRLSAHYVKQAVRFCLAGEADAMVTGPICKAAWQAAGETVPGHTEMLQRMTQAKRVVMMLTGGGLRVALVTIHAPLSRVPRLITRDRIIKTVGVVHTELQRSFGLASPRIAVLGLNPHAGEEGLLGKEETRVIAPALKVLQKQGIAVAGPVPADTAFHHALGGAYDAVVAMYHDQGLGPLKTVAFDCGVNITLGMSIIRTSVDHGTAFDIAGQGVASEASCVKAIQTAMDMIACRRHYDAS